MIVKRYVHMVEYYEMYFMVIVLPYSVLLRLLDTILY